MSNLVWYDRSKHHAVKGHLLVIVAFHRLTLRHRDKGAGPPKRPRSRASPLSTPRHDSGPLRKPRTTTSSTSWVFPPDRRQRP